MRKDDLELKIRNELEVHTDTIRDTAFDFSVDSNDQDNSPLRLWTLAIESLTSLQK